MDKTTVRNIIIFTTILLICAGSLIYEIFTGDRDIEKSDEWVSHTREVIIEAEQITTRIERMLASQRGYLITGNEQFLKEYQNTKKQVTIDLNKIENLTSNNTSQSERIDEIRTLTKDFSSALEERASKVDISVSDQLLEDVDQIDGLKDQIILLTRQILQEEYDLLNSRVNTLDYLRNNYQIKLLIGVVFGTLLLLILNSFLFSAQRKRSRIEKNLQSSEERFKLASEATQDGIFDWDLQTGRVFYSKSFFKMLGYNDKSNYGTTDDFKELLHPEDAENLWNNVQLYIGNNLSEYEQNFRLRHQTGRWIWIKSRAKVLRNTKGKAIRMIGAHTDITSMMREQEKLASEKTQAEERDQAKSEFLAHMSHEIRTPLNTITGVGEIMSRQKEKFDERQGKLIDTLHSSAQALKDLINDILDFSKIESGEIDLDEKDFQLSHFFDEIKTIMALRATGKGLNFILDASQIEDKNFYGDKTRLRQIVVNLVGNAIKFTKKGGVTIQVIVEQRGGADFLRVNVKDTGIGISPENFDLIFERFKQAESTVSRRFGGTGLGLPISKKLANLMGGDIILSSQGNAGSIFSLFLPIKNNNGGQEQYSLQAARKINQQLLATIHDQHRILIAEDYEGSITVLSFLLDEMGIDYDIAKNGKEAIILWEKNYYDLILMDVQMPEIDGFTATSTIRQKEKELNRVETPVIGMTAHALMGDKDKCIQAGMNAYLPKPLVEADLKFEILKFLNEREEKKARLVS